MSLNETASSQRLHIAFFGLRNAGKSSVVNAVTNQQLSLVSEVAGTTTDPVQKAMEILPLGPTVIIDTPGIDDVGELGKMRVQRAMKVLDKTDIAILVVDAKKGVQEADKALAAEFEAKQIPYITVLNKSDLLQNIPQPTQNTLYVSAKTGMNINELRQMLGNLANQTENEKFIVRDLLCENDIVILVTPVDESAPKGRLILPQQLVLREALDSKAISIVVQETELKAALSTLSKPPKMVITDSQAFEKVNADTPSNIPLTSFSILLARHKGNLDTAVKGAFAIDTINDGDTVLISEGCTHHRQCKDIGTVKLPDWISGYTKKRVNFEFTSGMQYPEDLSKYALVIHCGGCMLNAREINSRHLRTVAQNVPITNYGVAIAHMHGILKRSLSPFPEF